MTGENGPEPEAKQEKLTSFDLADLIGQPGARLLVKTGSKHWYEIGPDKSGNPNLLYVTSKHDPNNNGYMPIGPAGRLVSLGKDLQYYTNRRVLGKLEGKIVDTTPIIEMVLFGEVD